MKRLGLLLLVAATLSAQNKPTAKEQAFFARYPARHVALPAKTPRAIIAAGDRSFRTRLRLTLQDKVNFADHLSVDAWGCGAGCVSIGIADHATGKTYMVPATLFADAGRRLAFDRSSRAIHMVGYFNEKDPSDRWYEWTGSSLKLIESVKLPSTCFSSFEDAETLLPTAECNFQPPDEDE